MILIRTWTRDDLDNRLRDAAAAASTRHGEHGTPWSSITDVDPASWCTR